MCISILSLQVSVWWDHLCELFPFLYDWFNWFLPQVKEFQYLWILFMSDGKMECEVDKQVGAASAVTQMWYQTVVVKKDS